MYATSYTDALAGSRRQGRCIETHDSSAITNAARAGAKRAGARTYDCEAFFEFIT